MAGGSKPLTRPGVPWAPASTGAAGSARSATASGRSGAPGRPRAPGRSGAPGRPGAPSRAAAACATDCTAAASTPDRAGSPSTSDSAARTARGCSGGPPRCSTGCAARSPIRRGAGWTVHGGDDPAEVVGANPLRAADQPLLAIIRSKTLVTGSAGLLRTATGRPRTEQRKPQGRHPQERHYPLSMLTTHASRTITLR